MTLPDSGPVSIAPAESGIVYVATASGISRVDLAARTANAVKGPKNVELGALTRIRWHDGALAGLQKASDDTSRVMRITLDRAGRTATSIKVLDPRVSISNPTAATIVNGTLYYLANGQGSEIIVRKVTLP